LKACNWILAIISIFVHFNAGARRGNGRRFLIVSPLVPQKSQG
jgi:hypothetical protein